MRKKRYILSILVLMVASPALIGGTGRPEDGLLFFLVLLGFLGMILGILYLVEYIKSRIHRSS